MNRILEAIPDKQGKWKGTTSLKWKADLLDYFKEIELKAALEIGTNHGWTAYTLSYLAQKVFTVENSKNNYLAAKEICKERTNIEFILGDAYNDATYASCPLTFDLVVIDCIHSDDAVTRDIKRALSYRHGENPLYIAFDDYSHPQSPGVQHAVDRFIQSNSPEVITIGQGEGYTVTRSDNSSFTLTGPEGLILKVV